MNERDTKTVKIIILWVLVVIAITELAIMVDINDFIAAAKAQAGEAIEIIPFKNH